MVRLIITCTPNGDKEEVFFTEDFDMNAQDQCNPGWEVSLDETMGDLPSGFPLEYTLVRE